MNKSTIDRTAFDRLLVNELPQLRKVAWRYTLNTQDRDDLVQDTLTKAEAYWFRFKPGTNLRGWLYTIMRNAFINIYRHKMLEKLTIDSVEDIHSVYLLREVDFNHGESHFVANDIAKALSHLPETLRSTFLLYFSGYKYHELAAQLQIPIGTVKTRIHMARKFLKRYLHVYDTQSVA